MNGKRTREAVLEFQDYQATKGLLARGTAMARKAALGKVLGILSDDEAEDITKIDLDAVMIRFSNLQGKDYTPGSMVTYKSRVKAAIEDFEAYLANPLSFRPNVAKRDRTPRPDRGSAVKVEKVTENAQSSTSSSAEAISKTSSSAFDVADILPIRLRSDLVVRIQGLPFDMTVSEAKRIANVVMAMAHDSS